MSDVPSWDPASANVTPQLPLLRRWLLQWREQLATRQISADDADASSMDGLLSGAECARFAGLMRVPAPSWQPVIEALDAAELVDLIRFFTLAERTYSGWEAGQHSPVIAMAELLRARGSYPKELTAWIRRHSDNRFLPYGNLMKRL